MRWIIAAAVAFALAIGVALLIETPNVDPMPPGGAPVLYIGVVLVWGFVAVGASAWLRRPDNATGGLMILVGVLVGLSGLQFFSVPALFAIGVLVDTLVISALIHLLLAFPSGRVEGQLARRAVVVGYVAGAMQLPALLVSTCPRCPDGNPWLIAQNEVVSTVFGVSQALMALFAAVAAVVVL